MPEKNKENELLDQIEVLKNEIKKLKNRKKYGLVWEEKTEQVVLDCQNKLPILKEVKSKEIKTDKNKPVNILIEGDNYHSLSVLNYTHKGNIDVIYIDPPYNTGKEFVYNDKITEKEDSFRHSKWLSFMLKRLKLAKELLKESGVIFISIDDNEQAQLKLLCDEIFNENNFIACVNVYSNPRGRQSSKHIAETHEYILVYAKNSTKLKINGEELTDEQKKNYNKEDKSGIYREIGLRLRGGRAMAEESPTLHFSIYVNPTDDSVHLNNKRGYIKIIPKFSNGVLGTWRWSKNKIIKNLEYLMARKVKRGISLEYDIFQKDYITQEKTRKIKSSWIEKEINYDRSSQEQKNILGEKIFDYAKPVYLLIKIIKMASSKNSIVLDFMAGSGTTGHATLELNKEDGGNRNFILCTNNENNICTDICYPRIEKLIKGYENAKTRKVSGFGGNLSYYKTAFVDTDHISKISDEGKIKLSYQVGEMIALRENILDEVEKNDWWQIFADDKKVLAIYFEEDKSKLQKLVAKLNKDDKKVILYIFSWGKNEYKNEFSDYKNIRVEDIPEPILEVYKEINKL